MLVFALRALYLVFFYQIALIRDDVTKISLNVEPRLGGDHFAWFVDV